MEFAALFLP